MKNNRKTALLEHAGLAVVIVLGGLLASASAIAGIADTKHNLSSTRAGSTGTVYTSTGSDEICVFCHTPHGAATGADRPPLWNKALPTGSYTTYSSANSSTITGEVMTVGSVSIACLSCHDGTQAMDNIINAPGSGQYDALGGATQAAGRSYTWAGTGTKVDSDGKMIDGVDGGGANIALIGTDLRNDHPIGIQYCGGGITGTAVTGCTDADFYGSSANASRLTTATLNGAQVWWVDTEGTPNGSRQKTDMILYTRSFTAGSGPSVECATCHDPHVSGTNTFLRIANTGSAVCLSCHVK